MDPNTKPIWLICSVPISGHFIPMFEIMKGLVSVNDVLTGTRWENNVRSIGASFYPLIGDADVNDTEYQERWPSIQAAARGPAQLFEISRVLFGLMPIQYETLQRTLADLKSKYPTRSIALLSESAFTGVLPIFLGAPGLRPTITVKVSVLPLSLSSIDTAPFGLGLLPDSSPEGRLRNMELKKKLASSPIGGLQSIFNEKLKETGASMSAPMSPWDIAWHMADRSYQTCVPSLEYPRSDAPPGKIHFLGGVPQGHQSPWDTRPPWWDEIAKSPDKKRVIAVSQGTIAIDFDDLIGPTLTGLKDRDDVIVVAILAAKGRTLPSHIEAPPNARIGDYIPFDEILRYSDVFITNGGYGSIKHAAARGVPLVMAGDSEEKSEICARGEWAGIAVNLRTGRPSPEQIAVGVEKVLTDPKYKKRALEIMAETKTYDPLNILLKGVSELISEKAKGQDKIA